MFPKITAEESSAVSPDSVGHGSSFSKPLQVLWRSKTVLS